MLVKFETGKNLAILTRVDGKVSFPERSGPIPQPGEVWDVEVTGQNKSGSVNFLKLVNGPMIVDHNAEVAIKDGALFDAQNRLRLSYVVQGKFARIEYWEKVTTRRAKPCMTIAIQGRRVYALAKDGVEKYKTVDFAARDAAKDEAENKRISRIKSWKEREAEATEKWSKVASGSGMEFGGMYNDQTAVKLNGVFVTGLDEKSEEEVISEVT